MGVTVCKKPLQMMSGRKLLVVVVGPTCSGKTEIAIRLARHFHTPVVSTDSRQIYRGIPIGTAQPTVEEMSMAEHHMIGFLDLQEDFNCGQFERMALDVIRRSFVEHEVVIAAGGSGLYIKALCEGMDEMPDSNPDVRRNLELRLAAGGLKPLVDELRLRDPSYCTTADLNNPQRVVRALEVCISSGRPFSSFHSGNKVLREFNIVKIGIDVPREILYERINRRVDAMIEDGLEAEARSVYHLRNCNSLRTVGYSEMFDYFDGRISLPEAIDAIKLNTRHYAKRQMTWFRKDPGIRWFRGEDFDCIVECIGNEFAK